MSITAAAIAGALAKKAPLAIYHALKKLGDGRTDAADEAFREAMDAMTVFMASQYDWSSVPEDEMPTLEDAKNATQEFNREYERASGNPKRKLLFNALFGYFNPKFYRSGMSRILWDYAVQLEYPDAEFLRRAIEKIRNQMKGRSAHTQLIESGPNGGRVWMTMETPVDCTSPDYELALRLEAKGFVRFIPSESNLYVRVAPKLDLVEKLMEFVWEGAPEPTAADGDVADEGGDDPPVR